MKLNLFAKMSLPVLGCLLIIAIAHSTLFYRTQALEVKRLEARQTEITRRDITDFVWRLSQAPKELNRLSAKLIEHYTKYDAQPMQKIQQELFAQISAFPEVDAVFYGGEDREFVGYAKMADGIELMVAGKATEHAIRFYTVDEEGHPVTLKREAADFPIRMRPWYLAAKQHGDHHWGEIFTYHAAPIMAAPTSAPVFKDDIFLGVIGNNIFLRLLGRIGLSYCATNNPSIGPSKLLPRFLMLCAA